MELSKLACGPVFMLRYALALHRKNHQGRNPCYIVLHPKVIYDLHCDRRAPDVLNLHEYPRLPLTFCGIKVVTNSTAEWPMLVNWRRELEYV